MGSNPQDRLHPNRRPAAQVRFWSWLPLLLLSALPLRLADAQASAVSSTEALETTARVQVVDGEISTDDLQLYRVTDLRKGQTLYVSAEATSGSLDPLAALLRSDVDLDELRGEVLDKWIEGLSREHDAISITRQVLDRYALAWSDDYQGHYYAAFGVEIPADGEYRLAIGRSLVRASAGTYRMVIGVDEPDVLAGHREARGPAFVFAEEDPGASERGVALVTGTLDAGQTLRFYNLANLAAGQTLYAYAEATSGDLKPVLSLHDYSDKPVAYANFAARESRAALHYRFPQKAERYRLKISGEDPAGKAAAGDFRLLIGLNAPEVLRGEGQPGGREVRREPIPVGVGVKLRQITAVDQKAENFGVVATLVMHWRDPALAFDPDVVKNRRRVFTGDEFDTEMNRRGLLWPKYTIVNQQGRRWVQNRLVVVLPDGEVAYLEEFSATLQAPEFDFSNFPFDQQTFYIRVDLLAPEWEFVLRDIPGYSEVGAKLGEEEWVVTDHATRFSRGMLLQRPVSRFEFEFHAKRHIEYYFFRILLPLTVIIGVSWILFFLKDYAKRVDAAGANLLLFIAFNFAISRDLPRLGYLTFLDTLLISAFLVTAVVLVLSVYLRRQEMEGRPAFVAKFDHYVIGFYPLAYLLTIALVTLLFR